jgi:hypothetical protein
MEMNPYSGLFSEVFMKWLERRRLGVTNARGSAWIVTRRGQPFSLPASRLSFARTMYALLKR